MNNPSFSNNFHETLKLSYLRPGCITHINYMNHSKRLMLSNDKYNSFMSSYRKSKHIDNFKFPSIKKFPQNPLQTINYVNYHQRMLTLYNESSFGYRVNTEPNYSDHSLSKYTNLISISNNFKKTDIDEQSLIEKIQNFKQIHILKFLRDNLELKDNLTEEMKLEKEVKQSLRNYVFFDLSLESISLEIYEKQYLSDNNDSNCEIEKQLIQKIVLPFDILPFFYSISLENFLFFLSQILPWETNKNNTFTLDYENIKQSIKDFISICPILDIESNYFHNTFKKNLSFTYDWLRDNKIYEIHIFPPKLKCNLKNTNKDKQIHFELIPEQNFIIYQLIHQFVNWDSFCISLLKSYKLFRNIYHSINNSSKIIKENFYKLSYTTFFCKWESFYPFFITLRKQTFFMKLFSYQFFINYQFDNIDKDTLKRHSKSFFPIKTFQIPSKIKELPKLYLLQKHIELRELINKCIIINNQKKKLELNSELYNSIDIKMLISMKGKDIIINNVNPKIDIISPLLQWRTISTTRDADSNEEHIQFSKKDYKISEMFLSQLVDQPLKKWYLVINQNINEIFRKRSVSFNVFTKSSNKKRNDKRYFIFILIIK